MLVAKKSSGIQTPKDIQGKKVGLWEGDFRIQPQSFFQRHNLAVRIIPQSTTLNLFLRGGVDVASAMWYNEYHMLLATGLDADELTIFFLADHDLNFPEDGIYCMEDTFKNHPGKIVGIKFKFNGVGEVDMVRLSDLNNSIVFEDSFNHNL